MYSHRRINSQMRLASKLATSKTFRMTKAVFKYLYQVWGYRTIKNVDPETFFCILENTEDAGALTKSGKVKWTSDFAIRQAVLKFHKLPVGWTTVEFRRAYHKGKAFG